MAGLRLNLGCGEKRLAGFVNVDKFGSPDVKHDLESFPWPWDDNSVCETHLIHVLEHIGREASVYLRFMQELYRVSEANARIRIIVPHFRHDYFWDDPTHVRAVTPLGIQLFSRKANREWIAKGAANSPLALYLDVDFELVSVKYKPGTQWFRLHPDKDVNLQHLLEEGAIYNNLIEQIDMVVKVVK